MTRKPSEMRAWICRGYGVPEMLTVEGRPKPAAGDNKVLIRIHATTASSGDVRVWSLKLPRGFGLIGRLVIGITCPRQPIRGTELAATIESLGSDVTDWKVGDAVIAFPGGAMGC